MGATEGKSGRTYYPNMDLVRYVLSFAVIIAHINVLAGYDVWFPVSSFEAVGGFFALSGFLMYPNYLRHNSLAKYTRQRARRILPPYFFIVIACALCFVFISSVPAQQYFFSGGFWKYLAANLTFLNWLEPALPGVFEGDEYYVPAVNGSLWTMKVEWCLYFSVPIFIYLLRKVKPKRELLAITIIIISIAYRLLFTYLFDLTGKGIYEIMARQIFGQLAYFYCGMLIYFYKDFIQKNLPWFALIGVLIYIISSLGVTAQIIFNPVAVSMLVMSVCFIPNDIKFLRHKNNVSYEMYLFHFPIIQLAVYFGLNSISSFNLTAIVVAATVVLSLMVHYCQNKLMSHSK